MVKVKKTPRDLARLSFSDGRVVVSPRDMDVFVISAAKAIEACQGEVKKDEHLERFSSQFLAPLHDWCLINADKIRGCYLALPSDHIPVFVVTNSRRFDFEFAEKVAGIELQLAQAGWSISVSQLPETDGLSLATFFNPEQALQVYANG